MKKYGDYGLPYIRKKDLFCAVSNACNMISDGKDVTTAVCDSAGRYGVQAGKVWALVQESDFFCNLIEEIKLGFDNLNYNLDQIYGATGCVLDGDMSYGDDISYQLSYARKHYSQAVQALDLLPSIDDSEDDEDDEE